MSPLMNNIKTEYSGSMSISPGNAPHTDLRLRAVSLVSFLDDGVREAVRLNETLFGRGDIKGLPDMPPAPQSIEALLERCAELAGDLVRRLSSMNTLAGSMLPNVDNSFNQQQRRG